MERSGKMKAINRGHGLGSLMLRGSIWYLRYKVNGCDKLLSLGTEDQKEAEVKANEILPKSLVSAESAEVIAAHVGVARRLIAETKSLSIVEAWEAFEKSPERGDCKTSTLDWYKGVWNRFETWVKSSHPEAKTLKSVSRSIAAEYATFLWGEGVGATTFNHSMTVLRTVFNALKEQSSLEELPFVKIERKKGTKNERLGFSVANIADIMSKFDLPEKELYLLNREELRVLFGLGAYTGLRLADAALLKWESVDMEQGIISTKPLKTARINRTVKVPMLSELRNLLDQAASWKDDSDFVLPKMAERYGRNPYGILHDVRVVLDKAGFDAVNSNSKREKGKLIEGRGTNRRKYGFHSFRHAFASICASRGVPITTLSEILGDNVTTLQGYYLHPDEGMRSKVQDALALPSAKPKELPEAHKLKPEEKLKRIADVIAKAEESEPLKEILSILQS